MTCYSCGDEMTFANYYTTHQCKKCHNAYMRAYRKSHSNREYMREYLRRRKSNPVTINICGRPVATSMHDYLTWYHRKFEIMEGA